jgi:hypothetical protein
VCCTEKSVVGIVDNNIKRDAQLTDIYPSQFENNVLPDGIMFLGSCGKHYLCIDCMRSIINNYENHPINEDNSHFACPSPFEECVTSIGFQNVFDHNQIQKICRTTQEWENYYTYAQQYAFPGYTVISCPFNLLLSSTDYIPVLCNTPVLIETEEFRQRAIGDLVAECSQNEACLKRFCYYCRKVLRYYEEQCIDCKLRNENENPNVLNYYFNKHGDPISQVHGDGGGGDDEQNVLHFEETDYLYFNKDITVPFAVDYITKTIQNHHTHMICPVCKISLYKTERCNGLSHHGIERCYACGRIGFKVRGLGNHWNADGQDGCYRFDSEKFVTHYIPDYHCTDSLCSNHDKGDCQDPEHQHGIQRLEYTRKRAYVYHLLKSLLPTIRYQVYDELFDRHINDDAFIEYLPYKQSLVLVDKFREHFRDYYENIVYKQLDCIFPSFTNKKTVIDASEYVVSYSKSRSPPSSSNDFDFDNTRTSAQNESERETTYNPFNWLTEVPNDSQENSTTPTDYDSLPSTIDTSNPQWDEYWTLTPLLTRVSSTTDSDVD